VDPLVELANSLDNASTTNEPAPQYNAGKPLSTQSYHTPNPTEGEVHTRRPANKQPESESDTDLLTHVYMYAFAEK
jgi:hypothetical protein